VHVRVEDRYIWNEFDRVFEPGPELSVVAHRNELAMRLGSGAAMDAHRTARLLAIGRIGFGVGFGFAPQLTAPLWIGRAARNPGARFFCRIVGARDFVLGAGQLAALADGDGKGWILAGVAADAADFAATVAMRDELPPAAVANAIATTVGAVALGLLAYRGQS
jgi:hypothetical protein